MRIFSIWLAVLSMTAFLSDKAPCDDINQDQNGQIFSFALPEGNSPRETFTRHFSCYLVDGVSGLHDPDCVFKRNLSINTSHLPELATESLKLSTHAGSILIDIRKIRSWWNTWSLPLRAQRGQLVIVPNDLSEFERNTQFKTWNKQVINRSHVKNKTRVIYRSNSLSPDLSVSQTLDTEIGDLNARILETEISVERNDGSGNYDYYAYNEHGQLSTTAQFPAGERTVPGVCVSCHYSASTGRFGRAGK